MSGALQTVGLEQANAGMVLAEDLRDDGGQVLLPAGATLSEATLLSLRRRGIASLNVVGDAPAPDAAALQAERERQCQRLARLFRASATQGATGRLLDHLLAYRRNG
jgi:hypothetical protein